MSRKPKDDWVKRLCDDYKQAYNRNRQKQIGGGLGCLINSILFVLIVVVVFFVVIFIFGEIS